MKKLLIISSDIVASKMAGPGIRYLNLAIELSSYFQVALAIPNFDSFDLDDLIKNHSVKIISTEKRDLKRELKVSDSVLIQGEILWKYRFIKKANTSIIVDLYDPFVLEHLEINKNDFRGNVIYKNMMNILIDQLKYGDYFICASEKQKDFWLGALTSLLRINLKEYQKSKSFEHLIGVVPFGIPSNSPLKDKKVMKGIIPGIDEDDKVILWGGGIWEWFDPLTLIKAMKIVNERDKSIKLFFMGINHPNKNIKQMNIVKDTIQLSDHLGLTNNCVFFNDWVKYEDRHNYLLEADLGINIHKNHIETRYSFRTRILDYVWTRLPVISNEGDYFAEEIKRSSIGLVIDHLNEVTLAEGILSFPEKKEFSTNFDKMIIKYQWNNNIQDLLSYLQYNYRHKRSIFDFSYIKKIEYIFLRILELITKRVR
ncbi:hypothetical protein [Paenibacillus urinalis]|uniref:hypothetical protein n=1 Tax=Paenibacillus urinalis TaxID=521520 RepID=UPI001961F062